MPHEAETFDRVMQTLTDHGVTRVLILNVRRPVAWEYTANKRAAEGVSRWPQAERVDWHSYSNGQAEWFSDDAIHPTYTGAEAYVKLIAEALGQGS